MKPVAVLVLALASLGTPARAAPLHLDVELGGGSVIAWGASNETGNSVGGIALLGLEDFSFGVGGAAVLPDSRLQAEFGTLWLEGRWYPLGRESLLQPYAVAGLGFATDDGFAPDASGFVPARWSSAIGLLGMLGVGARYGEPTGMFLAADVRAWNHTHLGIQLLAGFAFF